MPRSRVKKFDTLPNYKSQAMQDLRDLPQGDIVAAHWISTFEFPAKRDAVTTAPIVLVGGVDASVLGQLKEKKSAAGKKYKVNEGGNVMRTEAGKWATDNESLKTALSVLAGAANVRKADPLSALMAELSAPPPPAWVAKWDKDEKALRTRAAHLPEALAEWRNRLDLVLTAARQKADQGGNAQSLYDKAVTAWAEQLRKTLDTRATAKAGAAAFKTLRAEARSKILDEVTGQIKGAATAEALITLAASMETAMQVDLQNALGAQRSPGRDQWMLLLGASAGSMKVIEHTATYRLQPEICHTHFTIGWHSANDKRINIHGLTPEDVLQAVFINGVDSRAQAHATLERYSDDAKCPHLYLDKTWDPKELAGTDDDEAVRKVLEPVRVDLTKHLIAKIKQMQQAVG